MNFLRFIAHLPQHLIGEAMLQVGYTPERINQLMREYIDN